MKINQAVNNRQTDVEVLKKSGHYTISTHRKQNKKIYKIENTNTGVSADICPEFGAIVLGIYYKNFQDIPQNILYQPKDFINEPRGIPILWPFANRIKNGEYTWNNTTISLRDVAENEYDGYGNAIHGWVKALPWKVTDTQVHSDYAHLSCQINTRDYPYIGKHFGDAVFTITYTIQDSKFENTASIENTSNQVFPMSLAYHPWFDVAAFFKCDRSDITIEVPSDKRWLAEQLIPTGEVCAVDNHYDLRVLRPLGEDRFDDVFTDLKTIDGKVTARISALGQNKSIYITATEIFKHMVVYAPDEPIVCIEPQTSATNAFNIRTPEASLIELAPHSILQGKVGIELV